MSCRKPRCQPLLLLALMLTLMPLAGIAQGAKLRLPDFAGLAEKAKESVEIALDDEDIRDMAPLLAGRDAAGDSSFNRMLRDLRSIHVMMFEFDRPGQYSSRDIDAVIRQVERGNWKRLIYMRGEEDRSEVWMHEAGSDGGLLVIISKPRELALIHIVGKVDLETLRGLQGRMGVPRVPGVEGPRAPPASPGRSPR